MSHNNDHLILELQNSLKDAEQEIADLEEERMDIAVLTKDAFIAGYTTANRNQTAIKAWLEYHHDNLKDKFSP